MIYPFLFHVLESQARDYSAHVRISDLYTCVERQPVREEEETSSENYFGNIVFFCRFQYFLLPTLV